MNNNIKMRVLSGSPQIIAKLPVRPPEEVLPDRFGERQERQSGGVSGENPLQEQYRSDDDGMNPIVVIPKARSPIAIIAIAGAAVVLIAGIIVLGVIWRFGGEGSERGGGLAMGGDTGSSTSGEAGTGFWTAEDGDGSVSSEDGNGAISSEDGDDPMASEEAGSFRRLLEGEAFADVEAPGDYPVPGEVYTAQGGAYIEFFGIDDEYRNLPYCVIHIGEVTFEMFYRIGDDQKTSLMFDHERIPYDQRESLDSEMIQAFMGMARVRAEGLIVKSYPQDGTEPQDYYFYRS